MTRREQWGLEGRFALAQASYWMSVCALVSFALPLLAAQGYTNLQIGATGSFTAVMTIVLQLILSQFSDARSHLPIKIIIAAVLGISLVLATLFWALPVSFGLMLFTFGLAGAFLNTGSSLHNALFMQYVNRGAPVRYGLPRGTGSISYASFAFLLGLLIDRRGVGLIMPISLTMTALAILMVLRMPLPEKAVPEPLDEGLTTTVAPVTNYAQILLAQPILGFFLLAVFTMYVGQASVMMFLARVVEGVGGTKQHLGIAMFLQAASELPVMLLSPLIIKRFKPRDVLLFSFTFYVLKAALMVVAKDMSGLYVAMGLSVFCFGLFGFASVYFLNSLVKPREKVRAQGLCGIAASVGGIVGNLAAGRILDHSGLRPLLVFCLVMQLVALVLMWLTRRRHIQAEAKIEPTEALAP